MKNEENKDTVSKRAARSEDPEVAAPVVSSATGSSAGKAPSKRTAAKKQRKSKRKADRDGLPQRPLSAYNYYVRFERRRLAEAAEKGEPTGAQPSGGAASATKTASGQEMEKHKREFSSVGKRVAQSWKELSSHERKKYQTMADEDMARYLRETNEYQRVLARTRLLEQEHLPDEKSGISTVQGAFGVGSSAQNQVPVPQASSLAASLLPAGHSSHLGAAPTPFAAFDPLAINSLMNLSQTPAGSGYPPLLQQTAAAMNQNQLPQDSGSLWSSFAQRPGIPGFAPPIDMAHRAPSSVSPNLADLLALQTLQNSQQPALLDGLSQVASPDIASAAANWSSYPNNLLLLQLAELQRQQEETQIQALLLQEQLRRQKRLEEESKQRGGR